LAKALRASDFQNSDVCISVASSPTQLECKDEAILAKLVATRLSIEGRDCSFAPLLRLVPGLVYGMISNVSPFHGILDIGRDLLSSYGEVLSLD
jgi:hypothetical protein